MAQEQRDISTPSRLTLCFDPPAASDPGEDMISAMAQAEAGGERLTHLEILATCNMRRPRAGHVAQRHRQVAVVAAQFPDQLRDSRPIPN